MKFFLVLLGVVGLAIAVPKSLQSDFDEFLALIPLEDIKAICDKYLANDPEVQEVVEYLQGEEWAGLVEAVAEKEQYQKLKQYLRDAGIDIDSIIQKIHDLLQGAHPSSKVQPKKARTLRDMLDEIKEIIPIPDLIALLNDKLQNSQDFIDFYQKVSSEETKALVDEVRNLDEVQRLAAVLKEKGIDLTPVMELIYGFFGWE